MRGQRGGGESTRFTSFFLTMATTKKRSRDASNASPSDAFTVLMQQNGRRTTAASGNSATSAFVLCPIGCGKSFLERDINFHLDECLAIASSGGNATTIDKDSQSQAVQDETMTLSDSKLSCTPRPPSADQQEKKGAGDVFSVMLQNARKTTRKVSAATNTARFHLHSDGHVSWEIANAVNCSIHETDIQWSAIVSLKPFDSTTTNERCELVVSTSIPSLDPSASPRPRLVRKHSRLSVPVLKSILQKAIRRRRPLPAAKVAMELADKSLGELLRRLPIIVLEDSTLHPDIPLLCWLMVAHSKVRNLQEGNS